MRSPTPTMAGMNSAQGPRFVTPSRVVVLAASALTILLTSDCPATNHPFHVSIAEAEFNSETKCLEVALKVYPGDLERALQSMTGRPIRLEKTDQVDKLIVAYLQRTFSVVRDDQQAAMKWVGKELSIKDAWLYFELELPDGLEGSQISQQVFFELQADQANTITFRRGKSRKSLTFSREQARQVFSWAEEPNPGRDRTVN